MSDIAIRRAKGMMAVLDARAERRSPAEVRWLMTSPEGTAMAAAHGWHFKEVAPDVWADVREFMGATVIAMIESGEAGKGNVGRWLDSLMDRQVIVTAVISPRLEGMLRRRGFECLDPGEGHWAREAQP